jgi:sensor histidine kinase YesM
MLFIIVVGGVGGYALGTAAADGLTGQSGPSLMRGLARGSAFEITSVLVLSLIPSLAITYWFYSREMIALHEAASQSAQRQAAEHQLKLLESQLEPHMLFNTLANLRVLIGMDPLRAQVMLDQLIGFLRATLDGSRAGQHPLRAEFLRVSDYLALMQVRMGERLHTRLELPPPLEALAVPPLLLQPLVENCIKHGLEPAVSGGRIDVRAQRDGATLVLTVRDTGIGLAASGDREGTRFGLLQVRERLATLYGAAASLTLAPAGDAEGGTLATIRLPIAAA